MTGQSVGLDWFISSFAQGLDLTLDQGACVWNVTSESHFYI